jgi:hypothetical protein
VRDCRRRRPGGELEGTIGARDPDRRTVAMNCMATLPGFPGQRSSLKFKQGAYVSWAKQTHRSVAMRTAIIIAILLSSISAAGAQYRERYLGDLPTGSQPPAVSTNPYGNSPRLYDSQDQYRGNLNSNPYDPNRVPNPSGRFGSPYSPYRQDNPNNPYGQGIGVYRRPP